MPATSEAATEAAVVPGSFRDPSGFVFTRGDRLLRQVNRSFAAEFDAVASAGLYDELAGAGLLVRHEVVDSELAAAPGAHAVIEPERVPFVSYPYEWCFGQLQDAALLTLDLQLRALERGFTLRDASAYNVQFVGCRPVFIDTLSLAPHREGTPWVAYRQFCEHFLVPLALMAHRDVRCAGLLRHHLDGIPLDLGSALLPRRTWASRLLVHLHLHARAQRKYAEARVDSATGGRTIERRRLVALLQDLRAAVASLDWRPEGTEWADYVANTNYSEAAADAKRIALRRQLETLRATQGTLGTAWDLGANTGVYSRVAAGVAARVVAFDIDPAAVERNYRDGRAAGEARLLPLLQDVANPSPALGWALAERSSLAERGPAEVVLALALIHHLAIGRNVPLPRIAAQLAALGEALIIEFVAKEDSQVQRLLTNREDVFPEYTQDGFERAFAPHFRVVSREQLGDARRWMYLMERA